jgi:hypothetical protein
MWRVQRHHVFNFLEPFSWLRNKTDLLTNRHIFSVKNYKLQPFHRKKMLAMEKLESP